MDDSLIQPRFYADTFDGGEYGRDLEENVGYRTPCLDKDSKGSEDLFDSIADSYGTEVPLKKERGAGEN